MGRAPILHMKPWLMLKGVDTYMYVRRSSYSHLLGDRQAHTQTGAQGVHEHIILSPPALTELWVALVVAIAWCCLD